MALVFIYVVNREDGTGRKIFRSKSQAEKYARTLKRTPDEKIMITREPTGLFAQLIYYV